MAKNTKQTSKAVATTASKILRDGRYGKAAKSVAGSALAQLCYITTDQAKWKEIISTIRTGREGLDNQPACLLKGRKAYIRQVSN